MCGRDKNLRHGLHRCFLPTLNGYALDSNYIIKWKSEVIKNNRPPLSSLDSKGFEEPKYRKGIRL